MLRGGGLRSAVTSGVAVAVAAVPEGLPLVATLAQQAAARRLTRASVLVRTPRSVEASAAWTLHVSTRPEPSARTGFG